MLTRETSHPCLNPISLPSLFGISARLLPCGKCANCLKRKANELVVRMSRQLLGRRVHLLTFTYRNESLPIYGRRTVVDSETGEVLKVCSGFLDSWRDVFLENAPFTRVVNKKVFRFAVIVLIRLNMLCL